MVPKVKVLQLLKCPRYPFAEKLTPSFIMQHSWNAYSTVPSGHWTNNHEYYNKFTAFKNIPKQKPNFNRLHSFSPLFAAVELLLPCSLHTELYIGITIIIQGE